MSSSTAGDEPVQAHSLEPLSDDELRNALSQIHVGQRIEDAFAWYLHAGISLGFARTAAPVLRAQAQALHGPISSALEHLAISLVQKAVLDASATYDQAGEGSSSLANALDLITRLLKSPQTGSSGDRQAARRLVDELRQSVIVQKSPEWQAIRYWRNKWAGHRSVDAQVDPWAWDNPVSFGTIETGLEQMRVAFNEFAVLLTQLPALAGLHDEARRVDDSTIRMGISLEGTTSWSLSAVTAIGEEQAQVLLDRMTSAGAASDESDAP